MVASDTLEMANHGKTEAAIEQCRQLRACDAVPGGGPE
jgi:hypothetical protein